MRVIGCTGMLNSSVDHVEVLSTNWTNLIFWHAFATKHRIEHENVIPENKNIGLND